MDEGQELAMLRAFFEAWCAFHKSCVAKEPRPWLEWQSQHVVETAGAILLAQNGGEVAH